MRIGIDHANARMNDKRDLAFAAETIVAAHRVRQLSRFIGSADVSDDVYLAEQCAIVSNYGRWLSLGVVRKSEVYDMQVLSNTKDAIGCALKECAKRLPLSTEEIATLGDMYFYLSYFHESWDPSNESNATALFAESATEGRDRRSEWAVNVSQKLSSRFSRLISSWMRPNA